MADYGTVDVFALRQDQSKREEVSPLYSLRRPGLGP
jgi:hypothetical protein